MHITCYVVRIAWTVECEVPTHSCILRCPLEQHTLVDAGL